MLIENPEPGNIFAVYFKSVNVTVKQWERRQTFQQKCLQWIRKATYEREIQVFDKLCQNVQLPR